MPLDAHSPSGPSSWGDKVAFAASPWYWPKPALVALFFADVVLFALAVWFWTSGAVLTVPIVVIPLVAGWLLFLRTAARSWRRWHEVRQQ